MFGFFKSKKADVLSHWYSLVPNFNASTKDFYEAVEKELKDREVPGLEMSRVEFSEGGLLSDQREYLRMIRERLVFDVCAAPFGTAYFFSCRFAELPARVTLLHMLFLFFVLGFFLVLFSIVLTPFIGPFVFLALMGLLIWTGRNTLTLGLKDVDAFLMKIPMVGPLYERFLRKETYYRQDTRLMYLDTVNAVVKEKVEEMTGAKGVKLIRFNEHSPILGELYKPTTVQPSQTPPAA